MNCYTQTAARLRAIGCAEEAAAALEVLNPHIADCALVLSRAESWLPDGWQAEMGGYGSVSLKRPNGGPWTSIRRTDNGWNTAAGDLCQTFPEALERVLMGVRS